MRVKPEFSPPDVRPAERRLLQILLENPDIRPDLLKELRDNPVHRGAVLEAAFEQVLALDEAGLGVDVAALAERVAEGERRLVFELAFDSAGSGSLEEARSCLAALEQRRIEAELREVQREIRQAEQSGDQTRLTELLARKQTLRKRVLVPEGS
jgi:hypothetical protein